MRIDIETCKNKITEYLSSEYSQPLFINVQNKNNIRELTENYIYSGWKINSIDKYCNHDENPNLDMLFYDLSNKKEDIILTGITSYLKLKGENELRKQLSILLTKSIPCKLVVLCYQCEKVLQISDIRIKQRVLFLNDRESTKPNIVFIKDRKTASLLGENYIDGIERLPYAIENSDDKEIYVNTKKTRNAYLNSLYTIKEMNNDYEVLVSIDNKTMLLDQSLGSEKEWNFALIEFKNSKTWDEVIKKFVGNNYDFDLFASKWRNFGKNKKWIIFIAMRLNIIKGGWCVNKALKEAQNVDEFVKNIYRSIADLKPDDKNFWNKYEERKNLIYDLFKDDETNEEINYCNYIQFKNKDTIYYLTDNTKHEKELIIDLICKYYSEANYNEIVELIKKIYPDLEYYLRPYQFNTKFLTDYFQEYKFEKVTNKIHAGFEKVVAEQAVKRDFYKLLHTRSEIVDAIEKKNVEVYFIDALGVEFLSFILAKCNKQNLLAKTAVCRASLPTITSCNTEFISAFENEGIIVNNIKELDNLKHKGEADFNYKKTKLPVHLIKELEIIEKIINKAKLKLATENIEKVIFISDHGASRLAVIKEETVKVDVESKGQHGGRYCEYYKGMPEIPYAVHEGDTYVLANYDSFKGGRVASVETHGGATLEEVAVPIIEITRKIDNIEIEIINKVVETGHKNRIPIIKLFSKTLISDLDVCVDGNFYDAKKIDAHNFEVELTELHKAGSYNLDVYQYNNLLIKGIPFKYEKAGMVEKDLL